MIHDVWWVTSFLVLGTELTHLDDSILGERKEWRKASLKSVLLYILRVQGEGRCGHRESGDVLLETKPGVGAGGFENLLLLIIWSVN